MDAGALQDTVAVPSPGVALIEVGAPGLVKPRTTEIVTTASLVPPGPVATIVSTAEANVTVGVPEMTPVLVFNDKPAGKALPDFKA